MPLLVDGHTVTDKGRAYTFRLRRGVKFHNGKELTAADVVASLKRWGRLATPGKQFWKNVEGLEAKDPSTVTLYLKEPSGALFMGLARPNNGAVIYPKEIVDAAGDNAIKDYVGTGPYRFVEHKPDRHVRLARFKDYAARAEPVDGFGGKRTAWVDEILFIPVPDVAVRLAGVETGEYHIALQIQQDQYDRMKTMPGVVPAIIKPEAWSTAVLNHKQGLMTDKRIRQAFQAALDMEPIMAAGFGNKAFYRLDPGLSFPEQPQWHSKMAGELYNQHNPAKARRLLQEAGYAGAPVRWITTIPVHVQERAGGRAAAGGGRLQDRPAGGGLGDARAAAQQARGVGRVLDGDHVQSGARLQHRHELQLAGLVVPRRQGALARGARARERSQEAARDVGEGPADLLRGRRAREVRRLLRPGRRPQGGPRLPADQRDEPLERLAQVKTYVARRLLALLPVALVVATVAFILIHLAPGDPASVIAGPDATADDVRRIERQLGLDAPLPVQLVRWYGRLARGDLGQSIFLRKPVTDAILDRVEPTLLLTLFAIAVSVAIGVPAGVISARHHNTGTDQALMVVALLGVSIPNFLLGLLFILVFSVWLGWFPVAGYSPLEYGWALTLRSLVLPAFALGLVQSALIARVTRSSMLDVLREQFITAGRAKGLAERAVVYKHALKNAMIPTITIIGISFAILISGAVVVETVFNIPGLGRLIISAVLRRDYPVIQGVVLCIAGVYMLINLVVDLSYIVFDPRVRYQ